MIALPKNSVLFLATMGGLGNVSRAPGTLGTLAGLPFCALLMLLPAGMQVVLILTAILMGMIICDLAARHLGEKDPSSVVLDEVVGLAVSLMLFPLSIPALVLGFLFFRLFDILKPWPVSFFDREVPGGAGIMLDDVAAGLCAHFCLSALAFFPWMGMAAG